jgi:predicted nucleic acid-binding protein
VRTILVDAGPLIALFAVDDRNHSHYDSLVSSLSPHGLRLITTWPCVVESSYLLATSQRLEMLQWIELGGIIIYPFGPEDLGLMIQAMKRYSEPRKREMDLADASLYWLAIETNIQEIMTTDHRDFQRYRLPDNRYFEIL